MPDRNPLSRIDDAIYRAEKVLCIGLIAAMVAAVFLDVVHRTALTSGPIDRLLLHMLPRGAAAIGSKIVVATMAWVFAYGSLRTARMTSQMPVRRAAAIAGGAVVGAGVLLALLVALFPNGLIWSQTFALCAMLWVGFLGSSMCTKEGSHITLEIMEFVWKGKAKAHVGRGGAMAAAIFCAFLAWLCLGLVRFHYGIWAESDGAVGTFGSFPIPQFVVYAILPISLGLMTLRFLGRALGPTVEEKPPSLPMPALSTTEEA